ncbi:FAD/NAD(P)-binding protein [Amycolatopsis silviterrae]|uniref:FAD/NAD(P)-binding protein n=1 Tax=Amycolatopsis silviterrae TaxID=1656914 RepID=A0ABW5HAP5_9PSEU
MSVDEVGSASLVICVVGAGPRGVSVVERVCANAALAPGAPVVVHLVDAVCDGGGRVWRTAQPGELLMNTVASQVTMFTDDSVDCRGPVVTGPSLYDWARVVMVMDGLDEYPETVHAEARRLTPDSYPSRSFYGHYVGWVLRRVVSTAPARVSVVSHRRVAVALDDNVDGTQVVTLDDGTRLGDVDVVVLAQGHVGMEPAEPERALLRFAGERGLRYFPPGNPADVDLSRIRAGESVALRGMGLNFFDYLALLTVGRGGTFRRASGRLKYRPSGREPLMYAGSRRGIPYHARGENQKGASGRHEPMFLTPEVIRWFRSRVADGKPLRFRRDLWPLITREVQLAYHRTLLTERDGAAAGDAFARDYVALAELDVDGLSESALLDRYRVAPVHRWNWDRVTRPWGPRFFRDHDEYLRWLLGYLAEDVAQAKLGNVRGPLKAAVDVLRDLRNEIRLVVDHGGLSGSSYRDELEQWYNPLNAFLSIGPPVRRIEEMIALIEAGVLRVLPPGMVAGPAPSGRKFRVGATSLPGTHYDVTTLVEARLPENDIARTTDPLLRYLVSTGQGRGYRIPEGDHTPAVAYETGGLMVTPRPYRLVDVTGRAHPKRFAFGVPTETVHWLTAAGIRPGVNSVILGDADAIARAALAMDQPDALSETRPRREENRP